MGWLKTIFAIGGGPVAWFTTAVGWVYSAVEWCVKHWKLCLAAAALLGSFYGGMRHERAPWQEKWTARDAKEKQVEDERIRTNLELDAEYQRIEANAAKEKAARDAETAALQERLKNYGKDHTGPVPQGAVCRAVDIGADGVQLINDAVRARHAGTNRGK